MLGYVLQEDVEHVLQVDIFSGCLMGVYVLWEVMHCLQDGIYCRRMCLTERRVLYEGRSYLRVCPIGGHVLQEHVLQVDLFL